MTSQEIFDTVAAHLLKQGKRAVDSNGACVYRAPDGCRCAFGCLIPDDLYRPQFEGYSAAEVVPNCPDLIRGDYSLSLVMELQWLHDGSRHGTMVDEWPRELRRLAGKYCLSSAVVDTCERASGIDWVA